MSNSANRPRYDEKEARKDAIALLEGPLRRRRWTPSVRDEIALKLLRTVNARIDEALEVLSGKP